MANHFLQDNLAPVREERTETDLKVTGTLPPHLDGRYLRIGPNPVVDPGDRYHWFLGDGMVHGVRIADGQALWYRNRYVRSPAVATALGEPAPGPAWPVRDFAANTNVVQHAGRTFALVESGPPPYELTEELDTVGPTDLDGTLRMGSLPAGYTAHPHEDPDTGELHAVSYNWLRGNRVDYTVLGTDGRVVRTVPVEVGGSPMMHDFALTEHYVVLYDLPVVFDRAQVLRTVPRAMRVPMRLMFSAIVGRNPLPDPVISRIARGAARAPQDYGTLPYSWDPEYPARLGLLPRDGSSTDVRWFEIDPCFVFHTLNAFEDGDTVVVDVVRHDRMFATVLDGPDEGPADPGPVHHRPRGRQGARGPLRRPSPGVPADRRAAHRPSASLRLLRRLRARPGAETPCCATTSRRVTTVARNLGSGREASEFCFVENDGATDEGDGVLMGYVHDQAAGTSDLVVLDAQTLEDVAAVHLPARVPAGFHGNWAPRPAG